MNKRFCTIMNFVTASMALLNTGCCNGGKNMENEYSFHDNSILIDRDPVFLKIFMNTEYLTSHIHEEAGHGLKKELATKPGLGDTVKIKFHLLNYYYYKLEPDSAVDEMIEISEIGDTISISINENQYYDTTNNDFELLSKSCACSIANPYIVIDSVYIEFDEKKILTVTEGIIE